jgi:hypothetical protein
VRAHYLGQPMNFCLCRRPTGTHLSVARSISILIYFTSQRGSRGWAATPYTSSACVFFSIHPQNLTHLEHAAAHPPITAWSVPTEARDDSEGETPQTPAQRANAARKQSYTRKATQDASDPNSSRRPKRTKLVRGREAKVTTARAFPSNSASTRPAGPSGSVSVAPEPTTFKKVGVLCLPRTVSSKVVNVPLTC